MIYLPYLIKELKLSLVILTEFIKAMRVLKHVEGVYKVELLVAAIAQVEVDGRCWRTCLLLDLHEFHKLFILDGALPSLNSTIIEGY